MRDETGGSEGGPTFELPQLCRYFSELSPQPIVAVEGTTHIVRHLNEAFACLVGRKRMELLGRPFAEAVPEGENNGCLALLDRVYRTGTPENLVEQQHRQTPPAYWSYVVWAILGSDDHPAGVMIQVTDVTETAVFRRQAVEMNQALVVSSIRQHELTEAAEKLNVSLKASEVALADLHSRKDEFLAMLSHELRNPLAAITNAVQLLSLQKHEDPLQLQARTIIQRQMGQLIRLVDDLMEVSRITSGRIHIQKERTGLNGIVERAVETTRSLIDQHRHELTASLSPQPLWLHADASRLEQVVVNLLTNAAKFTADGGTIAITVQREAEEAVLRVKDTGVGIAPELLPHIFDLFTQAERTLDRSQGGLGIGLSLVHRLVEMHGGRVEVSSVLGQGSEFVVRLPIADCQLPFEAKEDDTNRKLPIENRKSLRVLVVDDNVDAAESLGLLLKASGHDIQTAYDGPTALEAASDYHPQVVLLDIGLPGIDGYGVARRLRQDYNLKGVMLVAMTGYGQETDRRLSQDAGFDHHLVKPPDFAMLQQILATVSANAT